MSTKTDLWEEEKLYRDSKGGGGVKVLSVHGVHIIKMLIAKYIGKVLG